MRQTLINNLTKTDWLSFISVLMGALLLNETFTLWSNHFFTARGFSQQLLNLAAHNPLVIWQHLMQWVAKHSVFVAPLFGAILFITAIALIGLLYRSISAMIASFIFFIYFLSHLAVPEAWAFEYVLPMLFCGVLALAHLPQLFMARQRERLFGARLFQRLGWFDRLIITLLASAVIWIVTIWSFNAGENSNFIAWLSASSFAVLFTVSNLFEVYRFSMHAAPWQDFASQHPIIYKYHTRPWLDILSIIIGAMLVFQIYEDQFFGWFTVAGYSKLINVYAESSHAPAFFRNMLSWSAQAPYLMPIQLAIESLCSLCLVIAVLRIPFVLFTAGLLTLLCISELGVPAAGPIVANYVPTWTWELSMVSIVAWFISFYQIGRFLQAKTPAQRFLGNNIFGQTRFISRVSIAFVIAGVLACILLLTHAGGDFNPMIVIASGITLFFYLLLLAVIDYGRPDFEVAWG